MEAVRMCGSGSKDGRKLPQAPGKIAPVVLVVVYGEPHVYGPPMVE